MMVYLNEMTGIADAITSMFISKRNWSRELEVEIRRVCNNVTNRDGSKIETDGEMSLSLIDDIKTFDGWMDSLVKWGWKHITMLRFIDMSITVEGMHRGGQDDWDSHAKRFNNRIVRSSTRLAEFGNEISEYYEGKIIPTDLALTYLGIIAPDKIEHEGDTYIKAINGYIREDKIDDPDVKRGLYMLSIPSNFLFKIDLCEWGHVYKERNIGGTANLEVKQCCERIANWIESFHTQFNRELFKKIKN